VKREGAPPRILVADDANYFRQLVGDILREAGFEVFLAIDGDDALNKLVETSPDLIVLDLQLPGRTGFDVIKAVRAGRFSHLPILVMSSVYTGTDHIMALGDIGANDFINKNFTPDHLIARVRKLLKVL
jgi:DNA-binding response OmpR family regulator